MTYAFGSEPVSVIEFMIQHTAFLWKDYPMPMVATTLNVQSNQFSFSGICPHCGRDSVFISVAGPHIEAAAQPPSARRFVSVMQCQGCRKFILGIAYQGQPGSPFGYEAHYPLGKPNDDVPKEVPVNIASDFKEALRCRWVDAYNATVEMCRRAVQASCIQLNAPPDEKLVKQIDWLAEKGIITSPLKDMAHRVRLGGNLGAHPPEDPDDPDLIVIGAVYADAVIEFSGDFFQHVYVMPERLKAFTFRKTP
jgi:hypothetical protein